MREDLRRPEAAGWSLERADSAETTLSTDEKSRAPRGGGGRWAPVRRWAENRITTSTRRTHLREREIADSSEHSSVSHSPISNLYERAVLRNPLDRCSHVRLETAPATANRLARTSTCSSQRAGRVPPLPSGVYIRTGMRSAFAREAEPPRHSLRHNTLSSLRTPHMPHMARSPTLQPRVVVFLRDDCADLS